MSESVSQEINSVIAENGGSIRDALNVTLDKLNLANERIEDLKDAYFQDETIAPDGELRPTVSNLIDRLTAAEQRVKELEQSSKVVAYPEALEEILRLKDEVEKQKKRGDEWKDLAIESTRYLEGRESIGGEVICIFCGADLDFVGAKHTNDCLVTRICKQQESEK